MFKGVKRDQVRAGMMLICGPTGDHPGDKIEVISTNPTECCFEWRTGFNNGRRRYYGWTWMEKEFAFTQESEPPTLRSADLPVISDDEPLSQNKAQMMQFFKSSGCSHTCQKCGAPTPCKYHP